MTKSEKFLTVTIFTLILTLCLIGWYSNKRISQLVTQRQQINNINAIIDTNRTVVNSDSSKSTSNLIIENMQANDLLKIRNGQIHNLQLVIDEYRKQSTKVILRDAMVFETNDSLSKVLKTLVKDTISVDCMEELRSLVFSSEINTKWMKGTIDASMDTTIIHLKIHNEYSLVIVDSIQNKQHTAYGILTTKNPDDNISNFKIFIGDLPKSLNKQVSWGIAVTGGPSILISPVGTINYGIGVTIGLSKTLIPFNFLK